MPNTFQAFGEAAGVLTDNVGDIDETQMGARQYSPELGRFLQTDPIDGGNANAYNYPDDPINFADLTGDIAGLALIGGLALADTALDWTPVGWGIAIGLGVAALVIIGVGIWQAAGKYTTTTKKTKAAAKAAAKQAAKRANARCRCADFHGLCRSNDHYHVDYKTTGGKYTRHFRWRK